MGKITHFECQYNRNSDWRVQVNDPASAHHGKVLDVYIQDGKYHSIGKSLKEGKGDQVVDGTDCILSPGWFDMRVSFKEPGDEQVDPSRRHFQSFVPEPGSAPGSIRFPEP